MKTEETEIEYTQRGFARTGPVEDSYGGQVKVYESSSAREPHIWLSYKGDVMAHPDNITSWNARGLMDGGIRVFGDGSSSAHLTLDQAREVRDRLDIMIAFMEERNRDWIGND